VTTTRVDWKSVSNAEDKLRLHPPRRVSLLLLPLPPRSSITLVMADEFWAYDWQADGRYRRYLASAIQKVRDMSTALTVYSVVIG
jgi:hypothetical protein